MKKNLEENSSRKEECIEILRGFSNLEAQGEDAERWIKLILNFFGKKFKSSKEDIQI